MRRLWATSHSSLPSRRGGTSDSAYRVPTHPHSLAKATTTLALSAHTEESPSRHISARRAPRHRPTEACRARSIAHELGRAKCIIDHRSSSIYSSPTAATGPDRPKRTPTMVSLRLNNSPRVPSFAGPIALAAGLLTVICFSEPIWQNFFILKCDTQNVSMKAGAWGMCTKLRNSTGIVGPIEWCTSKKSGYSLNFVTNSSGVNNWPTFLQNPNVSTPTPIDENVLLGNGGITVLTSGQTSLMWLQVVTAILVVSTVASLACPPSYLGSPQSRLFAFQKSGILPILLALITFVVAVITFFVTLSVSMSGRNRLNAIGGGVSAGLGNTIWFTLASSIVMIPAICSVLMRSSPNEYQDL